MESHVVRQGMHFPQLSHCTAESEVSSSHKRQYEIRIHCSISYSPRPQFPIRALHLSVLYQNVSRILLLPVGSLERQSPAQTHLGEADVSALLAEALTADVQAVFADETSLVGADAAVEKNRTRSVFCVSSLLPLFNSTLHLLSTSFALFRLFSFAIKV